MGADLAQNVVSVNPDAAAVINVIWPTSVIWAVAHRDHIPNTWCGGNRGPINGRARSGSKENSKEKDSRFHPTRFCAPVRENGFAI